MVSLDRLQFEFRVIDKGTGDVVIADFTYMTPINEDGGCESVELHISPALRFVRRKLAKAQVAEATP